jgi:hypothetical protein
VAELTVMTWNVQNLLAVGHPDGPATDDEYRVKLEAVAEVIDQVGSPTLWRCRRLAHPRCLPTSTRCVRSISIIG